MQNQSDEANPNPIQPARLPSAGGVPTSRDLQAAYMHWCEETEFIGIALTLTFKPSWKGQLLTQQLAESAVRHFLSQLNRRVGRRRSSSPLRVIAVREGGIGWRHKRLHYHLKVEVPPDWVAEDFCIACMELWRTLDWASREQNHGTPHTDKHWVSYILKLRDKAEYSYAIDIMNSNLRSP